MEIVKTALMRRMKKMELIDRRKLVSDFWQGVEDCAILSYEDTDDLMESAPTVDAVEVVHGRWNKHDWIGVTIKGFMACSVCNVMIPKADDNYYCLLQLNYCPNCGAKMDGDGDA